MQILNVRNIGTNDIENSAVTEEKINNSAVTTAKINNSAVTTTKISDFAVTPGKLAPSAVEGSKIKNFAVTHNKISSNTIGVDRLLSPEGPTANFGDVFAGYTPTSTTETYGAGQFKPYGPLFLLPFGGSIRFSFQARIWSSTNTMTARIRGYGVGPIIRTIVSTSTTSGSFTQLYLTPSAYPGELIWLEFTRDGYRAEVEGLLCFRTTATTNTSIGLMGIFKENVTEIVGDSGPFPVIVL